MLARGLAGQLSTAATRLRLHGFGMCMLKPSTPRGRSGWCEGGQRDGGGVALLTVRVRMLRIKSNVFAGIRCPRDDARSHSSSILMASAALAASRTTCPSG